MTLVFIRPAAWSAGSYHWPLTAVRVTYRKRRHTTSMQVA